MVHVLQVLQRLTTWPMILLRLECVLLRRRLLRLPIRPRPQRPMLLLGKNLHHSRRRRITNDDDIMNDRCRRRRQQRTKLFCHHHPRRRRKVRPLFSRPTCHLKSQRMSTIVAIVMYGCSAATTTATSRRTHKYNHNHIHHRVVLPQIGPIFYSSSCPLHKRHAISYTT
jgi:hypothetical protein